MIRHCNVPVALSNAVLRDIRIRILDVVGDVTHALDFLTDGAIESFHDGLLADTEGQPVDIEHVQNVFCGHVGMNEVAVYIRFPVDV